MTSRLPPMDDKDRAARDYILDRFFPRAIWFHKAEGMLIPGDQGGYLITQAEWEQIKVEVELFYATIPAEHIAEHNRQANIKNYPDRRPGQGAP